MFAEMLYKSNGSLEVHITLVMIFSIPSHVVSLNYVILFNIYVVHFALFH